MRTMTLAWQTATTAPESLWSQTTPWEIGLFIAGVLFTLGLLAVFIWLTFHASREKH